MTKLAIAIREVAKAEEDLRDELLAVGERHEADADVFHVSRTLADWSAAHLERLRPVAERIGGKVAEPEEGRGVLGSLVARAREASAEALRSRPEPGLALLRDLRQIHLLAREVSVDWVMLGQAAQAARDRELLDVVDACHPDTLRVMRWSLTRIKVTAPEALTG